VISATAVLGSSAAIAAEQTSMRIAEDFSTAGRTSAIYPLLPTLFGHPLQELIRARSPVIQAAADVQAAGAG
jgi:hypothetical protein